MINEYLLNSLTDNDSNDAPVIEAMKYSLMAGGKRIRPVLCLAAADAVGGTYQDALTAACALEMIHTYSLIHDDLPAMDNDDLRRGKPTCHVQFDEATAILAGDALLNHAFCILSDMSNCSNEEALKKLKVINVISRGAGLHGMISGQMLDIESEGMSLDRIDLENIHNLKTGALIEASVCAGGILGKGSDTQIEKLRLYAKNIGLSFQVVDDILNVEGDPEIMGKAVGTDAFHNKNTYPSILGLQNSKKFAEELVDKAIDAIADFGEATDPLRHIAKYIIERKK